VESVFVLSNQLVGIVKEKSPEATFLISTDGALSTDISSS
jgi:hypothetical protein